MVADPVVIATRTGTMLVPGVSRNGRLYTREVIGKAVERMRSRIADPDGLPVVMRTHHDAGDDSTLIVGRITDVSTDESGVAKYRADLYDTAPGRDIHTLTSGQQPALRSTSIHGYWLGTVRRVEHAGETVETADDLEVDKIDFTATPGVVGAVLDVGEHTATETAERTTSRTAIAESWDPTDQVVTEADAKKPPGKPFGDVQYADPGYLDDKKKRYPLDTDAHVKAAWSYINQPKNAAQYSPKQLARIKQKIKAAMKRIGAKVSDETTMTRFGEIREYYPDGPAGQAGFCVDAYNGRLSITMRGCGIDPADLRAITTVAMTAACDALQAMDPDAEEGTDGPDDNMNETETPTAAKADVTAPAPARAATESTPATGASTTIEEVPAVSEAQENAAETTAAPTGRTLSDADIAALGAVFAQAVKESTPAAPVTTSETTSPTAESTTKAPSGEVLKETVQESVTAAVQAAVTELKTAFDTQLSEALTKQRTDLRDELVREFGAPTRKGFRVHENDTTGEPSVDDLFADRANALLGDFGRTPVPIPGTGTASSLAR